MSAQSRRQRRRSGAGSTRSTSQQRRQQQQRTRLAAIDEPVDYTRDYTFIRHDLKRLTIWSSLLFVCMISLIFVL